MQTLTHSPRCGASLSAADLERIATWIDLNAPYYPSYASAHPGNLAGRCPLSDEQLGKLEKLTGLRLRDSASCSGNPGPLVTFERPELSPCLSKFADRSQTNYLEALAIIRAGQENLAKNPEADLAGFQPSAQDQWRNDKYLARQRAELANRAALRTGRKSFDRVLLGDQPAAHAE